jgi:hypothetical protein
MHATTTSPASFAIITWSASLSLSPLSTVRTKHQGTSQGTRAQTTGNERAKCTPTRNQPDPAWFILVVDDRPAFPTSKVKTASNDDDRPQTNIALQNELTLLLTISS